MVGRVQSVHHGQWLAFWPPSAEDAGADGLSPHGRVVDFPSNADSRLDSMSEVFIKDGIRRHTPLVAKQIRKQFRTRQIARAVP